MPFRFSRCLETIRIAADHFAHDFARITAPIKSSRIAITGFRAMFLIAAFGSNA
jgi:hypothetical protein